MSSNPQIRIGIVGDLHSHWDELDVALFDRSDYDLLLFTGDLGGGTESSALRTARTIARLRKEALIMPGNNDTAHMAALTEEIGGYAVATSVAVQGGGATALAMSFEPAVNLCGYSLHRVNRGALDLTIIAGRPHSLGGPTLSFPEHMRTRHAVADLQDSQRRLCDLIDAASSRNLMFLAHNGPTGLGDQPADMWGCDFKPDGGDWGDPDLEVAVDHARRQGKNVMAVVAGHMHLQTRCGLERPWLRRVDGTCYVNASRVPRIFYRNGAIHRHHVALTISAAGAEAREVLIGA